MVTGPSLFGMGDTKLTHVFDGFGRVSSFQISDGEVELSSTLIDCKWLKTCQEKNKIASGLLFRETNPPRWQSKIPLVNIIGVFQNWDNNWVMPYRMPDKKTFVAMTDSSFILKIDP